ncbi:helix-turn-helix transcriptional regulator [Nesterenkonia aerolata]|uniref:Helix-turn-helix transcriptional regulator n=1 Tax=Nesterenkonia aerolata TaxID=3074079 RepID=A0ABU2DP19_9MICC|nr:helix-turn-helix transcriptional regulator [Nesterenkonia sp. LY-0111]MDR8018194.1 helix-turn-helix transcriptional regulator [Nesterenkonia sp. LY-0111]
MSETEESSESPDARVAENIKALRARAGMNQQEVADAMREAGFKWSQRTVWAVENGGAEGGRPLRLVEAYELLNILGRSWRMSTDDLVEPSDLKDFRRELEEFNDASESMSSALSSLFLTGRSLEERMDDLVASGATSSSDYARLMSRAKLELRRRYPLETVISRIEFEGQHSSTMAGELAADLREVWKTHRPRLEYMDVTHRNERARERAEIERRLRTMRTDHGLDQEA